MPRGYNVHRKINGLVYTGCLRAATKKEAQSDAIKMRKEGFSVRVIKLENSPQDPFGYKYWLFRRGKGR
jgi:hypothetical protein